MRTNGALNYLLGDHLGSTSLVTSANGTEVSKLYYKAWGETRYASGTTPTKYQYTGQYSYAADFGLMFYNARWYDPALGRFAQADTIVPGGVQGLDRYAYGLNNPSRYTDPTGHWVLETNKPQEEQRRNSYISAALHIKDKNAFSAHLKEYYIYAAAYYNSLASEAPQEETELGVILLKSRADNVRRNGWNGEEDAKSAAGDISLGNAPDMLGPATIGLAGLFANHGIPTSLEFDKRLLQRGFAEEDALTVYQNGRKYTDADGRWIRWNPKTKIAIAIDPFDGTAVTIFQKDQKPRNWEPGWVDRSLGIEPWE